MLARLHTAASSGAVGKKTSVHRLLEWMTPSSMLRALAASLNVSQGWAVSARAERISRSSTPYGVTMIRPTMPDSRWPGMLQKNSYVPGRVARMAPVTF